jgi:hypothetical protein
MILKIGYDIRVGLKHSQVKKIPINIILAVIGVDESVKSHLIKASISIQ